MKALLKEFYRLFTTTGCSYRAASLVYATLLSLVPLMIVTFTILSVVPHMQEVAEKIQDFIFHNFVADSAALIVAQLQSFMLNVSKLSWLNIVFLALVCVLMIYNMNCAFNSIWGVKHRRHLLWQFLIYFVVLLFGPPVFAASIVAAVYVVSLPYISDVVQYWWLKKSLFVSLPYLAAFVVFTLLNWVLPACRVRLRSAALAGLVTTVLFESIKWGFTRYLKLVPTYKLIYGALAAVPIFLVWLYLCWMIVLLGAMVARISQRGIAADVKNLH